MNRLVAAATTAAVVGALAVAVAPAGAATPSAGAFTPVAPKRVLDTRGTTPVGAGKSVTVTVAGTGRAAPAGVSAVAVLLNAAGGKGGYLTAFAGGSARPGTSNLVYAASPYVSNVAIVPVSAAGTIAVYNGSTGSATVIADVTGYYSGGTASQTQQGAYRPVTPSRLLDTRKTAAVKAGATVTVAVEGRGGVPSGAAGGVSAAVLNVTAMSGSKGGAVTAYATKAARPAVTTVSYGAGGSRAAATIAQTGADGSVTLWNNSTGTVQLTVDVQGYFTPGDPLTPGALGVLPPVRAVSARTIPARSTITLPLVGTVGIPRTRVSSVPMTVTVTRPTAAGSLWAYGGTTRPGDANLAFTAGKAVSVPVVTGLSTAGSMSFYNSSSAAVTLYVDVVGYVGTAALTPPPTTVSRYVTSIAAISGSGDGSEGCSDGASGASLVLLDIGAQTITSLGAANPGVALVFSNPTVRVRYPDLVAALKTYLSEFARCKTDGQTSRVAIGTNNSGAFSGANAYAATTRGTDWADDVVLPLRNASPDGVDVVGAIDLEAGFASSETQAEQWITSFLAADANLRLINNGSADNCPATFGSGAECGSVSDENGVAKTWTRAQYVRMSYGLAPGRISVLPQIYYAIPNQAAQWANIQATASGRLTFEGVLTQRGQCDCGQTPTQAWAALFHAQSVFTNVPTLPIATDLQPS